MRHILVKTDAVTSDNQAKAKLEELREQILDNKASFGDLANSSSADLASSNKGGELGWVTPDKLVPEFSNEMDKLAIDSISEPFKTAFGWHIAQVLERRSSNDTNAKLREKAQMILHNRKFEEKLAQWQRQMRDESYVKFSDSSNKS